MKLGRNDPCHCGSGKKYKKCHLARDSAAAAPLPFALPEGARVVRRGAESFVVSDGVSDEELDFAEDYFAQKDKGHGPAQQMVEFGQPLIDACDGTPAGFDKALGLAMVFWNLALTPQEEREQLLDSGLVKDADPAVRAELHEMARMMIVRHETMFPMLHARK